MTSPFIGTDQCPKCGFARGPDAAECPRCGIVYARWQARARTRAPRQTAPPPLPPLPEPVAAPAATLEPAGRLALMIGAPLGFLLFLFPLTNFILSYLVILVHEMGHAAAWWLFGYPAVPAFDFVYGGGVTMHRERSVLVLAVVIALLSLPFMRALRRPLGWAAWAAVMAGYAVTAFTPLAHLIALAMGHGAEILFGGLCFYRVFSGRGLIRGEERPLYALLGVFIVFKDLAFAWKLMFSDAFRAEYGEAKGGGHWMDFSRIAEGLSTNVETVSSLFFLATLAAAPLAWGLFRRQNAIRARLTALWRRLHGVSR